MWAVARPSTGHEGRVESRSRPPNRVRTGPEPVRMPPRWRLPGVASVTGWGLARVECRLATVGRRPQGIADGADGHAERIEADRTVPTYLRRHAPLSVRAPTPRCGGPWSIDAHTSTGSGREGRGGAATGSGSRGAELESRGRAAERSGLGAAAKK